MTTNFDEFFEHLIEEDMQLVEALLGPTDVVKEEILAYLREEEEKEEKCSKRGQSYIKDWAKFEELSARFEQATELSAQLVAQIEATLTKTDNPEKENTPVLSETLLSSSSLSSLKTTNSRPKRAAFHEASQMINKQVNMKLTEKLRREDIIDKKSLSTHRVKSEKLSTTKNIDGKKKDDDDNNNGGGNNDNDIMPPPVCLPIKMKSNRRIKKERLEISMIPEDDEIVNINKIKQETNTRGSDVILQEPRVSLVDLTISTNSSKTTTTTNDDSTTRGTFVVDKSTNASKTTTTTNDNSTRGTYVMNKSTKTKQSQSEKRNRDLASSSSDENIEKSLNKRSKIKSNIDNADRNDSEQTHYDDAVSDIEIVPPINATFVATSPLIKTKNQQLNTTIIIQKHDQQPVDIPDSLLTDDESDEEQKQSKHNSQQSKSSKQVFSAFEQSPVKKKVEAFEKLGASANIPARVTRTKTRALEQQQQQQQEKSKQQALATNNSVTLLPANNVKEKAKFFSPISTKINKPPTIKTAQTTIKTKAEENRQRDIDITEKRNARLQQFMEERRRKREEKELKAQQQREALERDKMKQLEEQERLKEERHKRLLFEQEQKKIKLREEAERKRLIAKQKALKEKQKEQQSIQKPTYMTMETPRLPTIDCYDSDEEDYRKKKTTALWCEDKNLRRFQYIMAFGGEKIKNTFFSRQAQTVDLQDLFQTTNPRVLKRTSSAHWTKAPKYSILPTRFETTLEKTLESSNEDEED